MKAPPFDLERFVLAQQHIYADAIGELRNGRKRHHWIWFVFPQIVGLGSSPDAIRYGIGSLEEARAYVAHRTLGARLSECVAAILELSGSDATQLMGTPLDAMKLRSSMTLFALACPDDSAFGFVIDKYFGGAPDPATLRILRRLEGVS